MSIHQLFPERRHEGAFRRSDDAVMDGKSVVSLDEQIKGAEMLADQLTLLLKNYKSLLEVEGMCGRVEALQEWSETHRNGLSAADAISRYGDPWINDLNERIKLAAEELNRMENEGGPPATYEQAAQVEALLRTAQKLEHVPILNDH